jgi:transposase
MQPPNTPQYKTETLEHLGLVAGMYDELEIGYTIDQLVPQDPSQRHITIGQALKAMVINGLGFANRRLYLTSHFFTNKPLERLIGMGIKAEHLNDDALGRALDAIHAFGVTELYSHIAARAVEKLSITPKAGHLDSSSFHVDGHYNSDDPPEDDAIIHITKGYSRDHRDDLNQAALELIVEHQASIPILMRTLSGNTSDKTAFASTIENHVGQLKMSYGMNLVVTDSAGYTPKCIRAYKERGVTWVMSVPATIKRVQELLDHADPGTMQPLTKGYFCEAVREHYAGVDQRWLLIYSEAARSRVHKSVDNALAKRTAEEQKRFARLCAKSFNCEQDALAALGAFVKTLKVLEVIKPEVTETAKYARPGRPAKDAVPDRVEYSLSGVLAAPVARREQWITRRSCFVLATNELDASELRDAEVLMAYKGQSRIERGFRFLKDPMFMASVFFVKRIERLMALLMMMTVCLLVYAALEYRIRQALSEHDLRVNDQKGKPTQRPSARWVFESFLDVHLLTISAAEVQVLVMNLDQDLRSLLAVLGWRYQEQYS